MKRNHTDPYHFDISELDPHVAKHVVGTAMFNFQDKEYEYGILKPEVAPIHYVVGMYNGQNLIGSSAIPTELQPYYFGHEILCNRLRAGQQGRCASIEKELIANALPEHLHALLQARMKTFNDLVALMHINVDAPENAFHAEIAATTAYLRKRISEQ